MGLLFIEEYSKAFVVLLIMYSVNKGIQDKRWFSPYFILLVTLVSFLLYFHELSPLMFMDLPASTLFMICGSFVALIFGFTVIRSFGIKPVKVPDNYSENFWIAFWIGIIPTLIAYYMFGNVYSMENDKMLEVKEEMSLPVIGQFAYFLPASILIACKRNNTKLIVLALISTFAAALFTLTKTSIVIAVVFMLIGISVFKPSLTENKLVRQIRKYIFLVLPFSFLLLFSFNNTTRHGDSADTMSFIEQGGSSLSASGGIAQNMYLNYLYFCNPWSNLQYNVKNNHVHGNGRNTFSQFGKKIGIDIDKVQKICPSVINTHSFLTDYYIDFGIIGSIIASFFLGCVIYFLYRKFGLSNDPMLLAFYGLICYATFMLFFNNHFNDGYLINYFITFGLYYLWCKNVSKAKLT